ncbi:hypothetical protein WICMUC_001995 [Wickerhamomyces mucosus]|uniref:Uncharacterized protein n=1 Tax=Wickerhamomyces mucosus TaxID=1378264 RepID=A0A9P8PS91_9ASCO|nr:hypothetical protein WICMUC_001995 [Wickerhamomyces mucosus]
MIDSTGPPLFIANTGVPTFIASNGTIPKCSNEGVYNNNFDLDINNSFKFEVTEGKNKTSKLAGVVFDSRL